MKRFKNWLIAKSNSIKAGALALAIAVMVPVQSWAQDSTLMAGVKTEVEAIEKDVMSGGVLVIGIVLTMLAVTVVMRLFKKG